ncbi:MAG TPA: hypothetical protein VHK24_06330 [Steroidobacter sp.]|nr:hypothetical protein [Steroidobacter sp.]
MRAALDGRDLSALPDEQAHCMAAALIARRCSVSEAALASVSKEIRDAFGSGDAEWRDLRADRRGIRCAQAGAADQQLSACCIGAEGS